MITCTVKNILSHRFRIIWSVSLIIKGKIGLGADFSYDGSISEAIASEDGTPDKHFDKLIRFGLHTSYATRYKTTYYGNSDRI